MREVHKNEKSKRKGNVVDVFELCKIVDKVVKEYENE